MPIQRSYQQSDIEKRLKLLTRQLYGKQEQVAGSKYYVAREEKISPATDTTYLKQDLIKIAVLSSLATLALFLLYFSQLPNKIKLF